MEKPYSKIEEYHQMFVKRVLHLSLIHIYFLVSCGYKKEAKEVTQDFFSAIKNNKEEKMVELYPEAVSYTHLDVYKRQAIAFADLAEMYNHLTALSSDFTDRTFPKINLYVISESYTSSPLHLDRKSTRLNSSHSRASRMPSSA